MAVVKERLARKLLFLLWSSTLTVSPARLISVTTIASRKDQPRRKRRMVLTLRWGLPGQRVFTFHPCQKEKGLLSQPLSSPLPQKRVEQGKTTNAYFTVCFLSLLSLGKNVSVSCKGQMTQSSVKEKIKENCASDHTCVVLY